MQHENQAQMTFKWQCGIISNCDYLLYLNSLADRTFNDITQYPSHHTLTFISFVISFYLFSFSLSNVWLSFYRYPVFPWVIADYTSPTLGQ
jgi:factor associated with neutral sphingomyelinase activation